MPRAELGAVDVNGSRSLLFNCPGCGMVHAPRVAGPGREIGGPLWSWNGDLDRPTLEPSILVRWSQWSDGKNVDKRCHSFVRDGRIEFLSDCTHALAGQAVDLPEFCW